MKPPLFTDADVIAADREIEQAMAAARGYVPCEAQGVGPGRSAKAAALSSSRIADIDREFAHAAVRVAWLVPAAAYAIGAALGDLQSDAAWLAAPGVVLAGALAIDLRRRVSAPTLGLCLGLHAVSAARLASAAMASPTPAASIAALSALALAAAGLWKLARRACRGPETLRIDPDFGDTFPQ